MADEKLTSLTALDAFASGDLLYSVDDPAGTPVSKKATIDQAKQFIVGDGSVSVASGKTLTSSNTLTLAGTDGTTMTFPSTSSTVAGLGVAQTFTATQTITPAVNTSGLVGSGYSLTGSANASFMDLAGTWNTSGTPTLIKANVTDTASNAASMLMDLQVGGTSQLTVRKNGRLTINASGEAITLTSGGASLGYYVNLNSGVGAYYQIGDVFLSRRGTANWRFGAADAAAPVAQTLSVQSVVAGTTNTAGANLTITGSQGTGTGAGGSIVFQVAPASGSSGIAQNALVNALTINNDLTCTFASTVNASAGFFRLGTNTNGYVRNISNTTWSFFGTVQSLTSLGLTSSITGDADTILARDAANTLALRNGVNAQTSRIYGSYTSASVYNRLALSSTTTIATVAAETDTGDMDLALTPAGAGNVRYGTHSAIGIELVTGYIEIKDAGGTVRKLAVVS